MAKTRELTPEHRRFVDEYLIDENGTRAYRVVYPGYSYKAAKNGASKWLKRADIQAELVAARAERAERTKLTGQAVLTEMCRLGFSDPIDLVNHDGQFRNLREIPLETRRCIQSVKVRHVRTTTRTGDGSTITDVESVMEYKMLNKLDALGKLAAFLGLNTGLPPLDAILAALPPELGAAIRGLLAATVSASSDIPRVVSANGDDPNSRDNPAQIPQ